MEIEEKINRIFKAYDIRGLVPEELDADIVRAIGVAVARVLNPEAVLVARDMRESGVELSEAFAEGLTHEGVKVEFLGLASTDALYFASGLLKLPGAMFTASHNPAGYNGIKLCREKAAPIGIETGLQEIKEITLNVVKSHEPILGKQSLIEWRDPLGAFAKHVTSFVNIDILKPLKVVADTANGMGGLIAPLIFKELPFSLEILFEELDGNFPNHPADPIQPENLRFLIKRIKEVNADIGLAFDGDADRVFLVDELGEPVSGSTLTAICAKAMLEKYPGETVLYNLICSKTVREVIDENGGKGVRTKVGHSFIKAKMAETDAVFGGEHSGHYYFRDNYRADSGIIAAMIVLEVLSKFDGTLSELRKPFERYCQSGEINNPVADITVAINALSEFLQGLGSDVDRLDGITCDYGEWWCNIRPSNTEPLLRLNVEANTKELLEEKTEMLLNKIKEL